MQDAMKQIESDAASAKKQPRAGYEVQYILPVDNPVNNLSMKRRKGWTTFFVPINTPDAHNLGYAELIHMCASAELSTVSPDLNNKT